MTYFEALAHYLPDQWTTGYSGVTYNPHRHFYLHEVKYIDNDPLKSDFACGIGTLQFFIESVARKHIQPAIAYIDGRYVGKCLNPHNKDVLFSTEDRTLTGIAIKLYIFVCGNEPDEKIIAELTF